MHVLLTRDADGFAADADDFLAARPERNVLATVLLNARRNRPASGSEPLFALAVDRAGGVCSAALRTPPWPLLACDFDETSAELLLEQWLPQDAKPPGVSAQPVTARAIGAAWRRHTGGHSMCRMREAMHMLSTVTEPLTSCPGSLRLATMGERALMIGWEEAFAVEADIPVRGEAQRAVDARMSLGGQFVWDHEGPVAMLGLSPAVAGTARIGPVYTPLQFRRRGYATAAVAAASRLALAAGARQVMLFTDLANQTSNRIYARVGFRRFADWEEHSFEPA